tara:strand:+ start:566 stop:2230 length:1665 start_codon:yes stop_codon:yes gene_type:complete
MRAHVILDEYVANSVRYEYQDLIICTKDVAKRFLGHENLIELSGAVLGEELDKFSNQFKDAFFQKFEEKTLVLCHVNDIFKFIMIDLFEIVLALRKHGIKEVCLYEGQKNFYFLSVFLAANTEVSKPLFSSRSRILNPLIFGWLKEQSQIEINWKMENRVKLWCIQFLRNSLLVAASTYTSLRVIGYSNPINQKFIALYRTRDQLSNLLALNNFIEGINFIQGPNGTKIHYSNASSFITIIDIINSFLLSIKRKLSLCFDRESRILKLNLFGSTISIPEREIERETTSIISSGAYELALARLAKNNPKCIFFSSEMTSRYAVIEKKAISNLASFTGKVVGIQFIAGTIKVPYFPIQDLLVARTISEHRLLQNLFGETSIKYFGNLSLQALLKKQNNKLEENIVSFFTQPYGQEDSFRIIKIIQDCLPSDWKLVLRVHPRDSADYKAVHKSEIDKSHHFSDLLVRSKIVVAKSSSILVDANELRKKVVSVCFDEYSRQAAKLLVDSNQISYTDDDLRIQLEKFLSDKSLKKSSSPNSKDLSFNKKLFLESLKIDS